MKRLKLPKEIDKIVSFMKIFLSYKQAVCGGRLAIAMRYVRIGQNNSFSFRYLDLVPVKEINAYSKPYRFARKIQNPPIGAFAGHVRIAQR